MNPPLNTPSAPPDPLAGLKDIHGPLEPGFWPPSWEFWLAFVVVLAIGLVLYCIFTKIKGPRWYKEAAQLLNNQLKVLEKQPTNDNIIELNKALKRIALSLHSRNEVAHLHGHAWCQWLNQQGRCNHFTQGIGQCLGTPVYSAKAALDPASVPLLKKILLDWLKSQKWTKAENVPKSKIHLFMMKLKSTTSAITTQLKSKLTRSKPANQKNQTPGEIS